MTAREASPQFIGRIARAQWGIEAVHHVRDTTFTEDASKIRTGHGPENMATLRNLAINTLRDADHHSIAAGLREVSYAPFTRPLDRFAIAPSSPGAQYALNELNSKNLRIAAGVDGGWGYLITFPPATP